MRYDKMREKCSKLKLRWGGVRRKTDVRKEASQGKGKGKAKN